MKIPHKFIKSEHGRSMVEILGVLAIIGMLSLGSVWLYDYASKFYEANHIQDSLGKAKNLADVNQSRHIFVKWNVCCVKQSVNIIPKFNRRKSKTQVQVTVKK